MLNTKKIDSLNSLIKNWNSGETSTQDKVITLLQSLMIKFSELQSLNSRKAAPTPIILFCPEVKWLDNTHARLISELKELELNV